VGSLSQFEEYAGTLLRGQLSAGRRIGGIGFLAREARLSLEWRQLAES
jgi:hypothetical protein